jgi:hypothetical protein
LVDDLLRILLTRLFFLNQFLSFPIVAGKRDRYQNGLTKILETAAQVGGMQKELIALQPKLKIAQKETSAKLVVVKAEEVKVGAQAAEVQKIVAACDITKAEALELKTSCEAMLAVAIPTLKAAEKVGGRWSVVVWWCVVCSVCGGGLWCVLLGWFGCIVRDVRVVRVV